LRSFSNWLILSCVLFCRLIYFHSDIVENRVPVLGSLYFFDCPLDGCLTVPSSNFGHSPFSKLMNCKVLSFYPLIHRITGPSRKFIRSSLIFFLSSSIWIRYYNEILWMIKVTITYFLIQFRQPHELNILKQSDHVCMMFY
jgi:hypothetical protein